MAGELPSVPIVSGVAGVHADRPHAGVHADRPRAGGRRDDIRSLTGLRGVAAWWVVLYHFNELLPVSVHGWPTALLGRGYLAVDLFFILSGFIIAYNYLDGFSAFDPRKYLHFLGVRIARIYPLHACMRHTEDVVQCYTLLRDPNRP